MRMYRGNDTLGDDTNMFSFVGGGFVTNGRVVSICGIWRNISQRYWLVASGAHSGSWLDGQDGSLKRMC